MAQAGIRKMAADSLRHGGGCGKPDSASLGETPWCCLADLDLG